MGVGKTSVGRALAARMGLPFVDSDAILADRFGPVATQIAQEGESGFRARERRLIAELADGRPKILATGGGAWQDPTNRSTLGRAGPTVVLTAPLEVVRARVGACRERPFWPEVEDRLRVRQPAYADADVHVDASHGSPERVASAVLQALSDPDCAREVLPVSLGERTYPIVVHRGGFRGLPARIGAVMGLEDSRPSRVVVITDHVVAPLWLPSLVQTLSGDGMEVEAIVIPSGEVHKTLDTWAHLVDRLLAIGVDRSTPIVALGGGVTGDLAGFAAATALRGLPLVQVPTTLLAMVDSSVGGKTGLDHPLGKNLIGAFHQPSLVWIPLLALGTLSEAERRSGLAEVVKIALTTDAELFEELERDAENLGRGALDVTARVVARSVARKAEIVAADEREAGQRAVLNAGHTVGHGLETALGLGALRHGEAVSIGLVRELEWAVASGFCEDRALLGRVRTLLAALGLPVRLPGFDRGRVLAAMRVDKKARGDMLVVPVPVRAGASRLVRVPLATLGDLLSA